MTNINIKKIKVENMTSSRGNVITNQFIIRTDGGQYFQSYDSIIAYRPFSDACKLVLDKATWDYSTTTGKYRNIFLGEDKKTTERKIKSGEYILGNLND